MPDRIASLTCRPVIAPMRVPLQTASGAVDQACLILIDLRTDEGVVGRSYLNALGKSHLKPILALLEAMAGLVRGLPLSPFVIEKTLRQHYALLGVHNIVLFAMSGIDMAAWDAKAIAADQPLVCLLGGQPEPIPAYNSKGLGLMAPSALATQAEQLVQEGFRAVKIRLGYEHAAEDLTAVRTVKAALGEGITLMADFNQGLTLVEALHRGRLLDEEGGLFWIEEPIRADDFSGAARLRASLHTPLMLGENFMGPEQMAQALAADCCDLVMPDAQRIGGVSGWMRAAAQAQAAGLPMSSHLFSEVSSHLMAVTPTAQWLEYVDWADAVLAQPLDVVDGCIQASRQAGSGIQWNEQAVKRFLA